MIEERRGGRPSAAVFLVVAVAVMLLPTLFGDEWDAVTDFIAELLSPVGLLLLPVSLLLTIQFLSSGAGSFFARIFSTGNPNSIHCATGSPAGVLAFLLLLLLLLYSKVSIFSDDDDSH